MWATTARRLRCGTRGAACRPLRASTPPLAWCSSSSLRSWTRSTIFFIAEEKQCVRGRGMILSVLKGVGESDLSALVAHVLPLSVDEVDAHHHGKAGRHPTRVVDVLQFVWTPIEAGASSCRSHRHRTRRSFKSVSSASSASSSLSSPSIPTLFGWLATERAVFQRERVFLI